ncbi:MAG: hypothetical protein CSB55_08825 [Candidatus Cloacimonadota bacterium]|nr:MAG: hypothetical protein CSB55_08825 [Candidatus Cloacimonadota bacterium]
MEILIPVKSYKGFFLAVGLIVSAFIVNYFIWHYNPELNKTAVLLESGDPENIAEALLKTSSFGTAKGYKLIPLILPLLGDKRYVSSHLKEKTSHHISGESGSGIYSNEPGTIGFSAALTLNSLIINADISGIRGIRGKAKKNIIKYITDDINLHDEYAVANALLAVQNIRDKRLLPFWFECLRIESESIRMNALAGLNFYISHRTAGLWAWRPEKEISPLMAENLKLCLSDSSPYIKREAENIIEVLKRKGFSFQ